MSIVIRLAKPEDSHRLHEMIRACYRSNAGWTNEADLVSGDRISEEQLRSHLSDAKMMSKQPIFVATKPTSALSDEEQEEYIVGCIQAQSGEIRPTFGLFAVDPQVQAQGIGKRLISKIFDYVKTEWKATSIDLWTFEGRTELIAYYKRMGFVDTTEENGGKKAFVAQDRLLPKAKDWQFVVLRKSLV